MARTLETGCGCGCYILLLGLLWSLASLVTSQQQATDKNFVFDVPDLTIDYPDSEGNAVNLQGFQITDNDKIIQSKLTDRYGELMWVSVGDPRIAKYNVSAADAKGLIYPELFAFRDDGFRIAISTLNDGHRQKLREVVKRKYGLDIGLAQIVSLALSEMECQIDFYKSDNVKASIFGSARNMNKYPLTVSFDAPKGSTLRVEFEKKLKGYMAQNLPIGEVDLTIGCKMKSESKTFKTNYFSVSSFQIEAYGLTESIFGPTNTSVLVTRDQMQELASSIYSKLRVYEDYQIPSQSFSQSFIDEIIKRVATESFKYLSLEQALSSLSGYDIYQDLKPDLVRKDLGKVFQIVSANGKKYVKVDTAEAEAKSSSKTDAGGASVAYGGVSVGANFAKSREESWSTDKSSVDEQLNEMNNYSESQIEWEKRGEMIVPKSIKVSRLSRSSFSKGFTIERIMRVTQDASFEKKFVIDPSQLQYEDRFSKILSEQLRISTFLKDTFGQSPDSSSAGAKSTGEHIKASMPDIKTSSRLSLVPRGTILQVALDTVKDSFKSDGKGIGDYDGWIICDGQNGTPDLRGRFLVGNDPKRAEYSSIGKTGGKSSVILSESNLPNHQHAVNIRTNSAGGHRHTYKDVFFSESNSGYDTTWVPDGMGSGKHDFNNQGYQLTRTTEWAGEHDHLVSGLTDSATNKTAVEFDIRPEYYTVAYIMFTGIYYQQTASQTQMGI